MKTDDDRDYLAEAQRQRDAAMQNDVERAKAAYLESLPNERAWLSLAELNCRLEHFLPRLPQTALLFAREELLDTGKIERDGVSGLVRRR